MQPHIFCLMATASAAFAGKNFPADDMANHSDCSSLSCRPHSAKIGLEIKLQKARRILHLLEKSQHSNSLLERLPEAQPLKTVALKDFPSEEYSKDEVIPKEQTTPESSDESPEKWFIPIDPRPYKSPDDSPETWFRPIVPKPYKSADKHSSKDEQPDVPTQIPSELSVDAIQESQPDSNEAQSLREESNLENKVLEPITLLALKIFNSLPKPRSNKNELNKKEEERKSVDNRSEQMRDGEKVEFIVSGNSVSQSKVALQKSKEEQKADEENGNNKGFEKDVHLRESILVGNGPENKIFGDKLSAPPSETGVSSSNTGQDNGKKIRFRPRKNYLSQLLRHTQVVRQIVTDLNKVFLQELGLVQKLGDIFTLFPERKEDYDESTQSRVCSPHI